MRKMNNTVLAKGIAALLAISAIAPGAVYAAETKAPANVIGIEAAEDVAIKDAGVKKEDVTSIRAHLERDDGRYVYDVDFYVGNVEYEYEILAEDGKILEKDKEDKTRPASSGQKTAAAKTQKTDTAKKTAASASAKTQTDTYIDIEDAKKIALDDAGLKSDEVTYFKIDFDKDGKIPEYEIEFFHGKMEYEYDINALTGEIIDSSAEIDD